MTFVQGLFGLKGRIGRMRFAVYTLCYVLPAIALFDACHVLTATDQDVAAGLLFAVGGLVIVWSAVAVTLKRAHDIARGPGTSARTNGKDIGGLLALPVVVLTVLLVVFWAAITLALLCRRGTPGPNDFGPAPDTLPRQADSAT